jgi:hypothetical protein
MMRDAVPEGYEIDVRPVGGDCVLVEARLTYRWRDEPLRGKVLPSLCSWDGPHPSHKYVYEPCWLFRLFGDSIEARIERAKRAVTLWATRELEKERRMLCLAERLA